MALKTFKDFNFSDFWNDSAHFLEEYVEAEPSDELIGSIESELGYKLPQSYVEFMKLHNGGVPKKDAFPTTKEKYWDEYGRISVFLGIGRDKDYSLCGKYGNQFIKDKLRYPDTGVYICDCPSGGHNMVMLDYSNCGKHGEPEVIHMDQELDYQRTFIAKDFETFIRELVNSDTFEMYENETPKPFYTYSEEEMRKMLEIFRTGRFSDIMQKYFKKSPINFDRILRNLFSELIKQKGYFDIEGDEISYLAFDIQFYLLSLNKNIYSKDMFVKEYIPMVANGNNEISSGGYVTHYMEKWFDQRTHSKQIVNKIFRGFQFTNAYKEEFLEKIKQYD